MNKRSGRQGRRQSAIGTASDVSSNDKDRSQVSRFGSGNLPQGRGYSLPVLVM